MLRVHHCVKLFQSLQPLSDMTQMKLALLSVVLLANIARSAAANNELASLASSAKDFDELCTFLGPLVPIPKVKSDNLCKTSGFDKDLSSCPFLGLTEKGLTLLSGGSPSSICLGASQTPPADTSNAGRPLPYPLSDQRPLLSTLSNKLLAKEGASYAWLWKNVLNFERWSGCAATNTPQTVTAGTPTTEDPTRDWMVPQGWTVHSTIWLPDGSTELGMYWPFATVIYKGSSLVVLVRGTETLADWESDFNYNQTIPQRALRLPGRVHQGFASIAASIWPHLRTALNELLGSGSRDHRHSGDSYGHGDSHSAISNVYVSGHSLGAGVATLIAYTMQDYLGSRYTVGATLFAAPNAGDAAFAAKYGRKVNARRFKFLNDLIPQVPCTPTMIGCSDALVPTATTRNKGLWQYTSIPGNFVLQPDGMPQQADAWSRLTDIYPCEMGRFLRATHTCSYNCFMSQYVPDNNTLCQLWEVEAGSPAVGTYCYDFPVTEGPQYPYKL